MADYTVAIDMLVKTGASSVEVGELTTRIRGLATEEERVKAITDAVTAAQARLKAELRAVTKDLNSASAAYAGAANQEDKFGKEALENVVALDKERRAILEQIKALQNMENSLENVANASAGASSGTKSYGSGLTQLTYALDDATQFQHGLRQGLNAMRNNIPGILAGLGMTGGMAGAVALIGTTAAIAAPKLHELFAGTEAQVRRVREELGAVLDDIITLGGTDFDTGITITTPEELEAGIARLDEMRAADRNFRESIVQGRRAMQGDIIQGNQDFLSLLEEANEDAGDRQAQADRARARARLSTTGDALLSEQAAREQNQERVEDSEIRHQARLEELRERFSDFQERKAEQDVLREAGFRTTEEVRAEQERQREIERLRERGSRSAVKNAQAQAAAIAQILDQLELERLDGLERTLAEIDQREEQRLETVRGHAVAEAEVREGAEAARLAARAKAAEEAEQKERQFTAALREIEDQRRAAAGESEEVILAERLERISAAMDAERAAHSATSDAYRNLALQAARAEAQMEQAVRARIASERQYAEQVYRLADERARLEGATDEEVLDSTIARIEEEMRLIEAFGDTQSDHYRDLILEHEKAELDKLKATEKRIREEERAEERQAREREKRIAEYLDSLGQAIDAALLLFQASHDARVAELENERTREITALEQRQASEEAAAERSVQRYAEGTEERIRAEDTLQAIRRDHANAQANLESQYDEELREAKKAQARFERRAAVAEIAYETGVNIAEVFPNAFLMAAAGALGVAQTAYVLSQPIPEFARGTLAAPGGMSLVGEEGPELRVLNRGDGVVTARRTEALNRVADAALASSARPASAASAFAPSFGSDPALRSEVQALREEVRTQTAQYGVWLQRHAEASVRGIQEQTKALAPILVDAANRPLIGSDRELADLNLATDRVRRFQQEGY